MAPRPQIHQSRKPDLPPWGDPPPLALSPLHCYIPTMRKLLFAMTAALPTLALAQDFTAPQAPRRILFIKLRHIGDSLLLTPTIVATKQKFPQAEIWVLVRESCDGILAGCPEIDRILTTANPDSAKRSKQGILIDLKLAALLRRAGHGGLTREMEQAREAEHG